VEGAQDQQGGGRVETALRAGALLDPTAARAHHHPSARSPRPPSRGLTNLEHLARERNGGEPHVTGDNLP
jgi:hypothetical protein